MPGAAPSTLSIMTAALRTLGIIGAGESAPGGEDTEFALGIYNQVLGQFNLRRRKAYFMRFASFTFSVARTSYTIGASGNSPAPNFSLTAGQGDRPVRIERAQVVLTAEDPDVFINIPVYNWPEYTLLSTPALTGEWPIAIYYEAATPNGIIYPYYSAPTGTANQLRLWWWNQIESVAIADVSAALSLPPGLERALTLRLAEALWLSFPKRTDLEELKRQSRIACADFESPNVPPPNTSSVDGVQGVGEFDYRSRTWI